MLNRKLAIAMAAAMVAAALYGCSSNGNIKRERDQAQDRVMELEGQLGAVAMALGLAADASPADILAAVASATEDQLTTIRTALDLATDVTAADIVASIMALQEPPAPPVFVDQTGLPDDIMQMAGSADIVAGESATIGEVTYSCAAGGEDCTVTVNEDGAAVSTGGMVTATAAQAYTDRKDAEEKEADRLAMVAAATKAANTKRDAIEAEAAQTNDNDTDLTNNIGLGGGDDTAQVDTYSLAIKRDRMATTVTIADTALAGDDDPKFTQAMDLGGGTTMHTRTKAADDDGNVEEEVVIVSTDIEAPEAVEFAKFEAMDGSMPQELDARDLDPATDADDDGTATNDFTALAVDETSADVRGLVMSTAFAPGSGESTEHTFPFDDASTTDMDEAAEVAGTYNGAMGTYRCNGTADCTVTVDDEGAITAMSDGWVFTPDMGATSDQPDYDYLSYGFWLKKTTDSDGAVTYDEVETFATSSIAASGDLAMVTGTATYTGGAVGVYTHRTFDTDGESNATSGHFTADASLTATFKQTAADDIAPNMIDTLRGTIDNFDLSGGETQEWSVSLSGDIDAATGTAASAADSDTPFSATFHGSTGDDDTTKPHSVVGEFNAGFTNGNVAGAFGAREVTD